MIHIDRCICTGRTFVDLFEQARRDALDLDALMRLAGEQGRRCGLCRPYLRHTLATGQCRFDRVLTEPPAANDGLVSSHPAG